MAWDDEPPTKGGWDAAPPPTQGYAPGGVGPEPASLIGKTWQTPDDKSPLSLSERGALGAMRYPDKQMNFLIKKYGEANVQINKMDENSSNFLVQDDDGIHQVDPHGLMDIPTDLLKGDLGQALNRIKGASLRNTIGGAVQNTFQYGPRLAAQAEGASAAFAPAFAAGTAMAAPLGPAAPLGGLALGIPAAIGGGALAGGAESAAEMGVRQTLQSLAPDGGAKALLGKDFTAKEIGQQISADMIMGGSTGLIEPLLGAGTQGMAKLMGKAIKNLGDTPEAKTALFNLFHHIEGMDAGPAMVKAHYPNETMALIPEAAKDASQLNKRTLLDKSIEDVENFFSEAVDKKNTEVGSVYNRLKAEAGSTKRNLADDSGMTPHQKTIKTLQDEDYIDAAGNLTGKRDMGGNNGDAIKRVLQDAKEITENNGTATYKDLSRFKENIDNFTKYGDRAVSEGKLNYILSELQTDLKNTQAQHLDQVRPGLSQVLADVDGKWSGLSEPMKMLATRSKDGRVVTFLKQVYKAEGTPEHRLISTVAEKLGMDDITPVLQQREAARQSLGWFGPKLLRIPGKLASKMVTGAARASYDGMMSAMNAPEGVAGQLSGAIAQPMLDEHKDQANDSTIENLKKIHSVYRAMPEETRNSLIRNPEAMQGLGQMLKQNVMQEQSDKSGILKQSGAFQNSQFGQ